MSNIYIQQFNKATDQLTKWRNKPYIQKKCQKWYYLQSFWIRIRYPINSLQTFTISISSPVSWWSLKNYKYLSKTENRFANTHKITSQLQVLYATNTSPSNRQMLSQKMYLVYGVHGTDQPMAHICILW